MAVTETPAETVAAASATAEAAPRTQPSGLAALLGSGDHKTIGRLYLFFSLAFGLLIVGLGEAFAIESIQPDTLDVFTGDTAFQLFTLTRIGTIFLLAIPMVIGVAMVVVPLQVGARSVAFPRLAAASFWGWLIGSALFLSSYAMNGGPGGGSEQGVNLWIASMGMIIVSVLAAALCLATTVLALRTTGLSLDRLPLFSWSVAVAAIMWLLTLPVAFGLLVIMYVDHRHAGGLFVGAPSVLYQNFFWLFRNPQIYVVAIPVVGFFLDVLATASGARMKMRAVAVGAVAAFGTFSFGAFLVVDSDVVLESPIVMVLGLVAILPLLAVLAVAGDLFRRGTFKLSAPVLYAVAAYLVLLLGVAAGALASIRGVLDVPEGDVLSNNIFFLGISHAVVLSAVIASLGGIHFWATKVGRQPATDKIGMLAPLVLLLGAVLTVFPDLLAGLTGEGPELSGYYTGGIEGVNAVAAAGIGLVAIGVALSIISFLPLFKATEDDVPADPWGGQSLEWLTASPPPVGNFAEELAPVTSAEPLIDLREEK